MQLFRSLFLRKLLSFTLVLVVLNLSIDPPDLLKNLDQDEALEEDISINEMESISELVLEQVLDLDGAIPETDEEETENYLKKVEVFVAMMTFAPIHQTIWFLPKEDRFSFTLHFFTQFKQGIVSPPPKA